MTTDKLTIDTPEQVHLEFMLAGIGSRFMAAFLDVLIEAVIYLVLFLSDAAIGPAADSSTRNTLRLVGGARHLCVVLH